MKNKKNSGGKTSYDGGDIGGCTGTLAISVCTSVTEAAWSVTTLKGHTAGVASSFVR